MKKLSISIISLIFSIGLFSGCVTNNFIEISESSLNGTRTKYFQLNSYDNSLDLTGSINLSSGKVIIQIESHDSGQVFFTNEYAANDNINLHIGDLNNQRNINMNVTGENAKGFSLKLTSVQKLVLDREHPKKPEK